MTPLVVLAQVAWEAQVIPLVARMAPVPGGQALTELRFVQSSASRD